MKENEPIGCRDESTVQTLQGLGIEAYFSGCLTLTLQPFSDVEKQNYVCLVDVPLEIVDYVKKKGYNVRVMSHNNSDLKKMSPEERLKQAEDYLKIYQGAHCVLTSRLHCALPCTGIGTPVLVMYSSEYGERFSGLKKFLHTTDIEDFLNGSWNDFLETPFCCSTDYMSYAARLSRTCKKFVNGVLEQKEKVLVNYCRYCETALFQNIMRRETYIAENHRISEGMDEARALIDDLRAYSTNQESAINELRTMNEELRKYSSEQERANAELRQYSSEQERANAELRQYSSEQERANAELRQYSLEQECVNVELKKRLDNLLNLSEKERKLIRFLRKIRK